MGAQRHEDVDHERQPRRRRRGLGEEPDAGHPRLSRASRHGGLSHRGRARQALAGGLDDLGELILEDCRLGADALLPTSRGLGSPLACLSEARYGIVWGSVGAARACLEAALAYTADPRRVRAAARGAPGRAAGAGRDARGGRERAAARDTDREAEGRRAASCPSRSATASSTTCAWRSNVARRARALLGANGITLEYPVMRHMVNLESVLTYEGTHQIHALVLGRALTGQNAF